MKAALVSTMVFLTALGSLSAQSKVIPEHLEMKGPYSKPQEITAACIKCHEKEAEDLFHSRHWNWQGEKFELHGKEVRLGKQTMLNNFCINIRTNEPRCTSCHIGYGWKDENFDFQNKHNMDCLVCHDQTGTYTKFPTAAGFPVYLEDEKVFPGNKKTYKKPDFVKVAQSVGSPRNQNCGSCHYFGGGGHNVKHGDLTKALNDASFEVDAHMGHPDPSKRQTCVTCHKKKGMHDIRGALHSSMAGGQNHFGCMECHEGPDVHKKRMRETLNMHTKSVACQTCHIPVVAKKFATKTWWDWSTAGDKKRKVEKDENGMPLYAWKKGDFKWEKELRPEYHWHNGKTDMYLLGEPIRDPERLFTFNHLLGRYKDGKSLITPFKVMRGKQFYDKKTNQLLVPHLFGKGGYWKTLDWEKAFTDGMKSVGLEYSGSHGVIETQMFWPVFHQVSPARKAVTCAQCHPKEEGKKGLLDWGRLGYPGDPVKTGQSRLSQGVVDW